MIIRGLTLKKVAETKRLKCIAYALKSLRIVTGLQIEIMVKDRFWRDGSLGKSLDINM